MNITLDIFNSSNSYSNSYLTDSPYMAAKPFTFKGISIPEEIIDEDESEEIELPALEVPEEPLTTIEEKPEGAPAREHWRKCSGLPPFEATKRDWNTHNRNLMALYPEIRLPGKRRRSDFS